MIITHKISMDLTRRGVSPRISVVQGDENSRAVEVYLAASGCAWAVPGGAACVVRYKKPDGHGGVYSTMPDGSSAYSVNGNTVTVMLVPQVINVSGLVELSVAITEGKSVVGTFSFYVNVERDPSAGLTDSADYFSFSSLEEINIALSSLFAEIDGITPAQIGAKAANTIEPIAHGGTGANTAELALSNLSDLHFNGDWQTAQIGISAWHYEVENTEDVRAQYNIPHGGCEILVMKRGAHRGVALAFGWASGQSQMWRNNLHDDTGSNKWTGWVDVKDAIGANFDSAVEYLNGSGDLNYATQPGRFYEIGLASGIANLPPVSDLNSLNNAVVYNFGQNGVFTQIYYAPNARQIFVRYYVSWNTPQWSEWEFGSPPMMLGVEYRTTERWNGKVVYAVLLSFGTMPSNASKIVDSGIESTHTISCELSLEDSDGFSYTGSPMIDYYRATAYGTISMEIKTSHDYSSTTAYFLIKYIKD